MKQHIFLSYCRDNFAEVERLHAELCQAGEAVWWDQDILPGRLWKEEIRRAMEASYAVLLCLSQEAAARTTSGIYPEARDAIEYYRLHPPGSIFLIPVRLSECPLPDLALDGTRTLRDLQYEDLFPDARRARGLQRLVRALQQAPGRAGQTQRSGVGQGQRYRDDTSGAVSTAS